MKLFIDASTIVAVIARESDAPIYEQRLDQADQLLCSAIVVWEAAMAIARLGPTGLDQARRIVESWLVALEIDVVPISLKEGVAALRAHERYGKGNHQAKLNFGDCFAYACAKTNGAALLHKGDDFAKTDLA